MTTARQLLNFIHVFEGFRKTQIDPEQMLRDLPDDQLHTALLSAAMLMQKIRDEAVRRGKWDEWKGHKVE